MKFRKLDIGHIINFNTGISSAPPFRDSKITDDKGNAPFVFGIERSSKENDAYRRAIWTGKNIQIVLMSVLPGDEIGWESHSHGDQLIIITQGNGEIFMGESKSSPAIKKNVGEGDAIIVPEGTLHNLKNPGREPLKIMSIYSPPAHPYGTVENTHGEQ